MVISDHLPILQVIVPLLAAPLCAIIFVGRYAWALATGASWLTFYISALLYERVRTEGTLSYALGGWEAPWGIEYRVDAANALVLLVVSFVGAVVLTYSGASVDKEVKAPRTSLYYTTYLLCLAGLLGMAATGDAFNVFVFLEISSLSSYALIALGPSPQALLAAYRYLIMGTIGASFILIGIGLMYMMTGTLNMMDLAERLPDVSNTRTIKASFAFLTVGLFLKVAVWPLHHWLPNAYTHAPSAATAFLAGTATKVALYLLVRFFFTIYGVAFSFDIMRLDLFLLPLSLLAAFFASLNAFYRKDVSRVLAYSSIAQIGYMTMGLSFNTEAGLTAALLHLFNHALIKSSLFLAVGCVIYRIGSGKLADFKGMGRVMPWTMAAFVVGGLSLIGVPLTSGFISKWHFITAALERDLWPVAVLLLVTSFLAVLYIGRIVEAAYFHPPAERFRYTEEAPLRMLVPLWLLALANVYFGINPAFTIEAARNAASQLMGTML